MKDAYSNKRILSEQTQGRPESPVQSNHILKNIQESDSQGENICDPGNQDTNAVLWTRNYLKDNEESVHFWEHRCV